MVNEQRVSEIKVSFLAPDVVRLFSLDRRGKAIPQPGVIVHMIGNGRFSAVRHLESGGKVTVVLEIAEGKLKPAAN